MKKLKVNQSSDPEEEDDGAVIQLPLEPDKTKHNGTKAKEKHKLRYA